MNINRHNYEEFFLLYVDNELSRDLRTEVEIFLQQNPDLGEEMAMLVQTTLPHDDVHFTDKSFLYKAEQGIGLANYEEYFLMYVDEELGIAEKEEVEKFVLQHPPLQESFTRLRSAKLEPELVLFTSKEILYRTDAKVVPFGWRRIAVAAALMGLVAALWFTTGNNNADEVSIASNGDKILVPLINDSKNSPVSQQPKNAFHPTGSSPANTKNIAVTSRQQNARVQSRQTDEVIQNAKLSRDNVNLLAVEKNDIAPIKNAASINMKTNDLPVSNGEPAIALVENRLPENETIIGDLIKPALYVEPEIENTDDNTIYIGGAEINKNKLRGLFKKATGIFDKRSKKADKENSIQIASFEIKTK